MKYILLVSTLLLLALIPAKAQTWQSFGAEDDNLPSAFEAKQPNLVYHGSTVYFAFQDQGNSRKITVRKYDGTTWANVGTPGFSTGDANNIQLKVAKDGTPYVGYIDAGMANSAQLKKFNGTGWVNTTPAALNNIAVSSFSFDLWENTPYVSYREANTTPGSVNTLKLDGTSWISIGRPVDANAFALQLEIDNNQVPYLAYFIGGGLEVKKIDGTDWVDVGNTAVWSVATSSFSLVIAPDNKPYIAYSDGARRRPAFGEGAGRQ